MSNPGNKSHTLADHQFGADFYHTHDGDEGADHDHDHDDFAGDENPEQNSLWAADHVTLTSVGIDIGSSGTQVVFSRLRLRRRGEDLSSCYYVEARELVYQSPVALTPYQSETRIDEHALGGIIDAAYTAAGLHPDDIDAGVVILTGEALRRENAEAIAAVLADAGGEFVCATAGHHMEAMLAGYGSGAARASHDLGQRILNIDIGGGTTKLAVLERGKVRETAAVHIGGRLLVADDAGVITRLDPTGKQHAHDAGFDWHLGDKVTREELQRLAAHMADVLVVAICGDELPPAVSKLYLTDRLRSLGPVEGVMFSGGVGEYVYGRETRDFGDLGKLLGEAVRARVDSGALPWPLLPAGECIRATALGASEYSVQLSGNTTYISNPAELLPRRNLQVLQPDYDFPAEIDASRLTQAIRRHFTAFDLVEGEADVALAFRWRGDPSHPRIHALATAITAGLESTIAKGKPLFIVLDGDIAQTLGAVLRDELGLASELLVIDGVTLWDFDYVDLGRIRMPSFTVPVTVKSLVFNEDPRALRRTDPPHRHAHGHSHDHAHPSTPGGK